MRALVVGEGLGSHKLLHALGKRIGLVSAEATDDMAAARMINQADYDLVISVLDSPTVHAVALYRMFSIHMPKMVNRLVFLVSKGSPTHYDEFFRSLSCLLISEPFTESNLEEIICLLEQDNKQASEDTILNPRSTFNTN